MRQFTALLKKEINGYFCGSMAYAVFFVYLFVSAGSAFYFGSYLAMRDSSDYPLFFLQPVILTVLLPALTMRSWSDEYKSGTAEFLLTQPLPDFVPVLAKLGAAVFWAALMSLCLLPFVVYTSFWLKTDWSAVLCCYAGVWLYIVLLCSAGCFISSLSRYPAVSYLLSVFVCGMWYMLPQTELADVYNNFLFAETGISDVTYFVLFAALFVLLNCMVPAVRRSARRHKVLRFCGAALLLVAGTAALEAALFIIFDPYKADFTQDGSYTLQKETKKLLDSLKEPVSVDVYVAKDLKEKNAEYYYYYRRTERFIRKYAAAANSPVTVSINEVLPFSETEKEVLNAGLYYEENEKGTRDYFGAIIRDGKGQGKVIKQFLPERKPFFEKDIDKALLQLTDKSVIKTIGIYFDPLQDTSLFNGFALNLEEDYNVLSVSEDTYEISPKLDLLILVNPKELSPYFMYAVDQYMANGGRIVIFFDLLTDGQSDETNTADLSIVTFLDRLKVLLSDEMSDSGTASPEYEVPGKKPELYKAISFTSDNKDFSVEPVITNKKGYIAAVLRGKYESVFKNNPQYSAEIVKNMMPYTPYGITETAAALVGDADIIEDHSWVGENSPDKNPYSVADSSANMLIVRKMIDKLAGNEIYNHLPQKTEYENSESIGEIIEDELAADKRDEYDLIAEDMRFSRLKLLQKSGGDEEKLKKLMLTDSDGLLLGEAEQRLESLAYGMRQEYSARTARIIAGWVLGLPCAAVFVLYLIFCCMAWRVRRKARGFAND